METEKTITTEESLQLISKMIKTVQTDLEDDSFYFLIWGWAVLIAAVGEMILIGMDIQQHALTWAVLMPLAGIGTWIYASRHEKEKKVKTYIDELMYYVRVSFLVTLSVVIFFSFKLQMNTYPIILMIYGLWLFISGGAMKFRPMIIGGIVNWLIAIPCFFINFEYQLIALALAVVLGYIIPGHLLRLRYRKNLVKA